MLYLFAPPIINWIDSETRRKLAQAKAIREEAHTNHVLLNSFREVAVQRFDHIEAQIDELKKAQSRTMDCHSCDHNQLRSLDLNDDGKA